MACVSTRAVRRPATNATVAAWGATGWSGALRVTETTADDKEAYLRAHLEARYGGHVDGLTVARIALP